MNAHSTLDIKKVSISTGEGRGSKKIPSVEKEGGLWLWNHTVKQLLKIYTFVLKFILGSEASSGRVK